MPRKRRPSTQNEISTTLRLLKLHLRQHPTEERLPAIEECARQLRMLWEEENDKQLQGIEDHGQRTFPEEQWTPSELTQNNGSNTRSP